MCGGGSLFLRSLGLTHHGEDVAGEFLVYQALPVWWRTPLLDHLPRGRGFRGQPTGWQRPQGRQIGPRDRHHWGKGGSVRGYLGMAGRAGATLRQSSFRKTQGSARGRPTLRRVASTKGAPHDHHGGSRAPRGQGRGRILGDAAAVAPRSTCRSWASRSGPGRRWSASSRGRGDQARAKSPPAACRPWSLKRVELVR